MEEKRYYENLAAAYVRGHALKAGVLNLPEELLQSNLEDLTEDEMQAIIEAGQKAELKIYRFKAGHGDMPRIKKVMGFLRGITFENILDVGSGRGVFLFPFLTEFPWVQVTSLDVLSHRVAFLKEIQAGGLCRLNAVEADICSQPFPDKSADVVTMLEVLEHIPEVGEAIKAAVRIARKYVVVSVPSKPDNNPEHIHLLTKERLTVLFSEAGCTRLKFDGVNGHLIMIASIE